MFCGNQQLSWHGTTIQAVQPHVSHQSLPKYQESVQSTSHDGGRMNESARSGTAGFSLHAISGESESTDTHESKNVSPVKSTSRRRKMNTPTKPTSQSPMRKKTCQRARTGTEFEATTNEDKNIPTTYPIHTVLEGQTKPVNVSIEAFQLSAMETKLMEIFDEEVTYYFLLKDAHTSLAHTPNNNFVGVQEYFAVISTTQAPEPYLITYFS